MISLFSLSTSANTFKCVLDTAHSKSNSESKFLFEFDTSKDTSKSLEFKDYRFLVWLSGDSLMVKLKGGEFPKAISVQFSSQQPQARFHYGSDFDFSCEQKSGINSQKKVTDFSTLGENVKIKVQKGLDYPYHQPEEVELMRTLFFQDKKVHTESSSLVPKLPWCSLRIQLSRNENTKVKAGEVFNPVSYQTHNNNSYFTTFSYSFVDFSTGKKMGATRLYNPFMLNCNLLRGMVFNQENIESVVGEYLDFSM